MTGGNFNKTRIAVTFLAVILLFGESGIAALKDDTTAISRGREFFSSGGGLNGYVDYAVYAPGKYDGEMLFPNLYVYAYQVFNQSSTVSIDYFSVGLAPDVSVSNVLCDQAAGHAEPGGSVPNPWFKLPQSVIYLFPYDNIGQGEHSLTLLFTSNSDTGMANGAVSGGFTGGAIMALPSPSSVWITPEPATFGLLIGGAFMAIRRKTKGLR